MGRRRLNKKVKRQQAPQTATTTTVGPSSKCEDNGLDTRFQWREGLPADYIFDEEKEMIKGLRDLVPQLEYETDKFVATFLFSRRHDIVATKEVLESFFQNKVSIAHMFPGQHVPSFKYSNLVEALAPGGQSMIQPKGFRDYKGRMIRHFVMEKEHTSARTLESTLLAGYWQTYYLIATEPLNAWRNGTVMILDMKNAGLRNIDLSPKGKAILQAMQGIFPFRLREIIIVNGGMLITALVATARLVLPRKFMDRVQVIKEADLKHIIPPQYLLRHYGGNADFWFDEFLHEFVATENELFAQGIFKAPQISGNPGYCCM